MSKINTVVFNNFRIFNQKDTIFDFGLDGGEIADLVVIYGRNGMGKTSFFDGIEWTLKKEIYRFHEMLSFSEKDKIILANFDNKDKFANVKVTFDELLKGEKYIERKTNRIGNSDYTENKNNKPLMNFNDFILPHDKIERFISSYTLSQKYDVWGKEIWDTNGEKRNLLEFLYGLKTKFDEKFIKIYAYIHNLDNELKDFTIDEVKLTETNNLLNDLNLRCSILNLNKVSNEDLYNSVYDINEKLDKFKFNNNYDDLKEINFLISEYNKYKSLKNNYNEMLIKNKRFKKLHTICLEKNQLTLLIEDLKKDKDIILDKLNIMNVTVSKNSGSWIKQYITFKDYKNIIKKLNLEILTYKENKTISTEKLNENKMVLLKDKLDKLLTSKELICELISDSIIIQSKITEKEKEIFNFNIIIQENYTYFKEINKNINDLEFLKLKKVEKNASIDYSNTSDIINSSNFDHEELTAINFFKEYNSTLQINTEKIDKLNIKKVKYSTTLNDINKNLLNIKNFIIENSMSSCPVCKTNFSNVNTLVNNIDTSTFSIEIIEIDKEIGKITYEQSELETELIRCIDKWNTKIIDKISSLEKEKLSILIKTNEEKQLLINAKNQLLEIKNKYEYNSEEIVKLGYTKDAIDIKSYENWFKSTEDDLKKMIECEEEQIVLLSNEIKELNIKIEQIEKNITYLKRNNENFVSKEFNYDLLNQFEEKFKINNFDELIDLLESIKFEYTEIDSKIDITNLELKKYDWIDSSKIDYFKQEVKFDIEDLNFIEVYKNNFTKNFDKDYDIYRMDLKLKKADKTLSYLKSIKEIEDKLNITNILENYNSIKSKKDNLFKESKKIETTSEKYEKLYDETRLLIEKEISLLLNKSISNKIFNILKPHYKINELKYSVNFNNKGVGELLIKAKNTSGEEIFPEWIFSSAQLNMFAFGIFLSKALESQEQGFNSILIDDPIGHLDDINIASFVDLIRNIISTRKIQFIISTHDEDIFNLFKVKIPPKYYKSKFIKFVERGKFEYV